MTEERKREIARYFENLRPDGEYQETSKENWNYNCIAWALHDERQWWWPERGLGYYWPPGVPFDNKRETLIKIFEIHGYSKCESAEFEKSYEKIAIYERPESGVEHAARQLQNGSWTSKLGEWEDISHKTPQSVECEDYGIVVQVMKRYRKDWDENATSAGSAGEN